MFEFYVLSQEIKCKIVLNFKEPSKMLKKYSTKN